MKIINLSYENLKSFNAKKYCEKHGIDPLELEHLNLSYNKITKIEGLGNLTKLIFLFLSNNEITKIEGLGNLTKLFGLYISYNKITKIENLDKLMNIGDLYLDNNKISQEQIDRSPYRRLMV